jgi:hypothetical protein
MQSYRLDPSGKLIGFHGSEIGLIVWILLERLWSKIQINGRLHSEKWWRKRLQSTIDTTSIIENNLNPSIYNEDGTPIPPPIPLEIEFNMPDLNYEMLSKAWRKAFPNA